MAQRTKITDYWIKYFDREDAEDYICYYDSADEMFYDYAKAMAFADCDDTIEVIDAMACGIHVEYYGWLPNMEFRFINAENREEIMWDSFYPQWEH